MEGGWGLLPPWDGRKFEFFSSDTRLWPAVPVYLVHSAVTRGVPKPPVLLHRHRGGPNLKMLPLSLRSYSSTTTSSIYIYRWCHSHF